MTIKFYRFYPDFLYIQNILLGNKIRGTEHMHTFIFRQGNMKFPFDSFIFVSLN